MAPRKSKHQHTSSMSGDASAEPETDASAKKTDASVRNLNLSVLTKHDPEVSDFLWVAPYAVVYVFVAETNAWEKSGIEGSFFICTLQENQESTDRYEVILLNRRGLDNFKFELSTEDQVEFTDELIIFHNNDESGDSQVFGIWIFSEPEPSSTANQPMQVAELLKQCLRLAQEGRVARAKLAHQTGNGDAAVRQATESPFGSQPTLSDMLGQTGLQDESWAMRNRSPSQPSQPSQGYQSGPTSNPVFYQSPNAQMPQPGFFAGGQQHAQTMFNMQQGHPQYHQQMPLQHSQQVLMHQLSPLPQMMLMQQQIHHQQPGLYQQHQQQAANPLGSQQQHLLGLFQKAKGGQPFGF